MTAYIFIKLPANFTVNKQFRLLFKNSNIILDKIKIYNKVNSPVSVSVLTRDIKYLIENNFQFVYLEAEISNFKNHIASGHYYFSLKDDKAQINAMMWSSRNKELTFIPDNGMKVLVKGRITIYESRGTYQIDVYELKKSGAGDLQAAYEELKRKLTEEGLFREEHKKNLPVFPERVGVITSESGAAWQDFVKVTKKRYPYVKLFLINALMQGTGSAESICKAVRTANNPVFNLDEIVITRGGGSMEDLWSFNDENLAREIFNSVIPVITAVGHEVDFTISDFVADRRAATPSNAAEIIFPDIQEIFRYLNDSGSELEKTVKYKLKNIKFALDNISGNYYFKKPADLLNENKLKIDELNKKLEVVIKEKLLKLKLFLQSSERIIRTIGPENTLKRGFAIIKKGDKIISRKSGVKSGEEVQIQFYDGEVDTDIN